MRKYQDQGIMCVTLNSMDKLSNGLCTIQFKFQVSYLFTDINVKWSISKEQKYSIKQQQESPLRNLREACDDTNGTTTSWSNWRNLIIYRSIDL